MVPYGFCPGMMDVYRPLVEAGFARGGRSGEARAFRIWAHVDVIVTDDVATALLPFKRYGARLRPRVTADGVWRGYGDVEARCKSSGPKGATTMPRRPSRTSTSTRACSSAPSDGSPGDWHRG